MQEQELFLDKKGREQITQELINLEVRLKNLSSRRKEMTTHNKWEKISPSMRDLLEEEYRILSRIKELKELVRKATITKRTELDQIDFGDIAKITLSYEDESEEVMVELVSILSSSEVDGIQEVTPQSPIGGAIYHKKVGEVIPCKIGENMVNITITEKLTREEEPPMKR